MGSKMMFGGLTSILIHALLGDTILDHLKVSGYIFHRRLFTCAVRC